MSDSVTGKLNQRAEALFDEQTFAVRSRVDRLFGLLLCFEWLAGILVSLLISPRSWSGVYSDIHVHVWTSVVLGGLIVAWPIYLSMRHPGRELTRHVIAVAQMLYGAVLIHLTGGRIETHFHVFGSLAFLSFYRDWRVMLTATAIVAGDHILRGIIFPQSVYGVAAIEPWRWLEHVSWVVFEDVFLIHACQENLAEMRQNARRQAEIELTRDGIEVVVRQRTKQLRDSELRVATQYCVTRTLTESKSMDEAAPLILGAIANGLFNDVGLVCAAMWEFNRDTKELSCISEVQLCSSSGKQQPCASKEVLAAVRKFKHARRAAETREVVFQDNLTGFTTSAAYAGDATLETALAVPVIADGEVCAVLEFYIQHEHKMEALDTVMLDGIAHQIAQFAIRRATQNHNDQLANMVQSSSEAIVGQTLDGVITSWNKGAEQLFGYSAEDVCGRRSSMLVPANRMEEYFSHLTRFKAGDDKISVETVRLKRDGKPVEVSILIEPVYDLHGRVVGRSVFMRDITERKAAEKRVSEFYSIVSHELRTPLTSIRGALGLIEGGIVAPDSPQLMELITVARGSSDRLIRLINDMLDLKKIEAGKMEFFKHNIDAGDAVQKTVNSLRGLAEEANIKLVCNVDSNTLVYADADKFAQILTNLGSNAIKFSPEGGEVVFDAFVCENKIRFTVSDNGCGIADDDKQKLFDKFQQLDSSDSRQKGGTGLGLAICRALVDQHQGTIGFDSEVGKGSTFWFELPLQSAPQTKISEELKSLGKLRGRVLLVEDDDELATVIGAVISHQGYKFVRADSLATARSYLEELVPDVVILDLNLPDGNGLDLLEILRADPRTIDTPVIVSTGQQFEEKMVGNATIVDWLLKPFDTERLTIAVERALKIPGKCKVLVVDDDSDTRTVLSTQLRAAGLKCIEAKDGLEAIYLTRKEAPDIIVLDVHMPHVDGFQVVEVLKHEEELASTPLVIYTGRDLSLEERDALTLGVTRHLTKGKNQWELSDTIDELLGGVLAGAGAGHG
jgi:PAS domain S-box-containing protein